MPFWDNVFFLFILFPFYFKSVRLTSTEGTLPSHLINRRYGEGLVCWRLKLLLSVVLKFCIGGIPNYFDFESSGLRE